MSTFSSLVSGANASIFAGGGSSLVAGGGSSLIAADSVTFSKAVNGTAAHAGPSPTYPVSVTLTASVTVSVKATRVLENGRDEPRPLAHTTFKVVTSVDPGVALGAPLSTNDTVAWQGLTLFVIGTAIPQGGNYLINAEHIG